MSAIAALVQRDLIRLVRRPSQLVATAGVPLLFAFVLGSGFDRAEITGAGAGYAAYLVPGTALLAVVFAATFAGMALIEDRNEGALRAIMLSPASPASIAAARLLSALILSLLPATLILITGALFGRIDFTPGVLATVAALALGSVAIGGISLALAWAIDSQRGFHGVLNLGLMPGWLLSGAVFPIDAASGWVALAAKLNPIGWLHAAACSSLGLTPAIPPALAWIGSAAAAAIGCAAAILTLSRRTGSTTP